MRGRQADRDALEHMIDHGRKVRRHTVEGPGCLQDEVVQAAVLRWLGIMGEAASRVSAELREAHPSVPWRAIVGFRNVVVHGYDHVDIGLVWDAIQRLTDLERDVEAILEELPE